ncbi:DUF58 domain-containing protein [Haloechinothrix salitolerans]|uniref:DUF58 domain-containing protein n=1 Tax=Haloechinothrix salitolerans TaxID=926830 RepID=A0ABW2C1W1_9PSEU
MTGATRYAPAASVNWRPSPLAVTLTVLASATLIGAVLLRRVEFLAFAAPLLGALLSAGRPSGHVEVSSDRDEEHCFASESVDFAVSVTAAGCVVERVSVTGADVDVVDTVVTWTSGGTVVRCQVRAPSWGRFAPTVTIALRAASGLRTATVVRHPVRLRVYPHPEPMRTAPRTTDLPDRIGAHIGRRLGAGVEFAGIRPYVPGNQLRMVNWHASARRGRLHVTERLAERSATVVALIDAWALRSPGGCPPPVRQACSLAVAGATQLARAALRRGDQAGVIALGGPLCWVRPDIGRRQFYRIADAVLDTIPAEGDTASRTGHSDLLPRGILPPSALVVAFTPLLDSRIATTLNDVRLRGHAVAVVDVLRDLPTRGETDPLVGAMWRWERTTMYRNFGLLGIPVVAWPHDSTVDEALAPLALRPLTVRRPSP